MEEVGEIHAEISLEWMLEGILRTVVEHLLLQGIVENRSEVLVREVADLLTQVCW